MIASESQGLPEIIEEFSEPVYAWFFVPALNLTAAFLLTFGHNWYDLHYWKLLVWTEVTSVISAFVMLDYSKQPGRDSEQIQESWLHAAGILEILALALWFFNALKDSLPLDTYVIFNFLIHVTNSSLVYNALTSTSDPESQVESNDTEDSVIVDGILL